jgi:hypothetical protein
MCRQPSSSISFPPEHFRSGSKNWIGRCFWPGAGFRKPPRRLLCEDILLAKLHWFKAGGEVSEVQWRDIQGIVRGGGAALDRKYLEQSAAKLGILALLEKALSEL